MEGIKIAHLFPDLLNLYGDGGNVTCLRKRCEWRGIPVEVVPVFHGQTLDLTTVDIVFLGGGPDREQTLASEQLLRMKTALKEYVEAEGVLLAICGGFQMLGSEYLLADESVEGLALIDMVTRRANEQAKRLISDIALQVDFSDRPVIGYENHAGRTFLGRGVRPFGKVISSVGKGNNDTDKTDGVLYKNVLGTYLHGPLLAKNPQIADHLLQKAFDVRASLGQERVVLPVLDDAIEDAANEYMARRLGVKAG